MRHRGGRGVQAAIAAIAAAGVTFAVSDAGAVNINDFPVGINDAALKFTPQEITISKGDTVVWDFTGSTTVHNVVSENDVAADPEWKDFSTPIAMTGQFRRQFNEVGEYEYLCDLHRVQGMVGKVTVVDAPVATPTRTPRPIETATPVPTFSATPVPTVSRDTPAPTGASRADTVAPAITNLKLKAQTRGAKVSFKLSESASVTLRLKRGKTTLKTVRGSFRAGTGSVTLRRLARGSYSVEIEARDARGNKAAVQRKTVKVKG